ncbi:restriction endonuclease [Nocardia sp. NPDC051321]|uniref:restriction endonuclease n=1 Tax=Nocardia sp. NPDC051321 TaxID=3364323 RepID=UPI0037B57B7C
MRSDASEIVAMYLENLKRHRSGITPYSDPDTFVEPCIRAPQGQVVSDSLDTLLTERRMLLLGDPAADKTTLIRAAVNQLVEARRVSDQAVCPILIHAPTLTSLPEAQSPSLWRWLAMAAAIPAGGGERLADILCSMLENGSAHLFIDGIDEISSTIDRYRIIDAISTAIDQSIGVRICVSTRPIDPASDRLKARFPAWLILPFNLYQASRLLSMLTGDDAGTVSDHLADIDYLASLSTSPLILHLLAFYSDERGLELPSNKFQLYEDLTDAILARERHKIDFPIVAELTHRGYETIALSMATATAASFSLSPASILDALVNSPHVDLTVEEAKFLTQFAINRSTILIQTAQDEVTFSHKSIQDFYIGRRLARNIEIINTLPPIDVTEALTFACGLASQPMPIVVVAYLRYGAAFAAKCCGDLQQYRHEAQEAVATQILADLGTEFHRPLLQLLGVAPESSNNIVDAEDPNDEAVPEQELFNQLRKLWDEMPRTGSSAHARGHGLEQFAVTLLGSYFAVVDVRRRHQVGEIDVICEIVNSDPFWANYGSDVWIECKNTEQKANIEQVNTFVGKLVGSRWRLGFFISTSGFTKDAMNRLKNVGSNPSIPLVVPISGNDIDDLLLNRTELQRFFKTRIRSIA